MSVRREGLGMPADDAARAVIRGDLVHNVIVEAAAGTGKTSELVKRIVAILREGRATEYDKIDVLKDKKGVVAKASQKALVWDNEGKNFLLIYSQNLDSKDTPFKGDFFTVYKFKSFKVKGPKDKDE